MPTQLVELIHLLHQRLGKHGICGLTYFSDAGSAADPRKISCFLEACTVLLSKYVQKTSIWDKEKRTKKSDEESYKEADKEENVKEDEYLFQMEACQCYRCLYDVQILPGCEDHKQVPPLLHFKMANYLPNMRMQCDCFALLCRYFWLQRRKTTAKRKSD